MDTPTQSFTTSEAAKRLGVSTKALRLYEQQGLVTPGRTATGYRIFGPVQMDRAAEVVALRSLGLSLAQVTRVLAGDPHSLGSALAVHEARLQDDIHQIVGKIDKSRRLRADLGRGRMPGDGDLKRLLDSSTDRNVAFELPWPWGGELFELRDIRSLNFIVGPLGSGKTRFAMRLTEALPDAAFPDRSHQWAGSRRPIGSGRGHGRTGTGSCDTTGTHQLSAPPRQAGRTTFIPDDAFVGDSGSGRNGS